MLLNLKIENFALIEQLNLELDSGLNILTGETGAGKSIILDALDAALGGKISARALRTGANRAYIEATFSLNISLSQWLNDAEIDSEIDSEANSQTLICSREITNRSSRNRINGVVVNKQQMQSIRELLLEITAQGQTVTLGQTAQQRDWLDLFGGHTEIRQTVIEQYETWKRSHDQLIERQTSDRQRLQQLDMLQFQLQELESAEIEDPEELDRLSQESLRLSHSVELAQQSFDVYEMLYQSEDNDACADLLGKAESILIEMATVDPELNGILEMIGSALVQVEEAGRQINAYGSSLEADPSRLQTVEERIRLLKQICRKYGPLDEAIAYKQKLQNDLGNLDQANQSLEALTKTIAKQQKLLKQTCSQLSQLRQQSAKTLEQTLITRLKSLAMEKVQFEVRFTEIEPSITGSDRLTFWFSANPGEPLQPLADTASGGEMSRFLLALKTCLAERKQAKPEKSLSENSEKQEIDNSGNTLVFDEIDVGVSGRVAQAIASQLYQLSRHAQILCVTHQPIIAAIADRHFQVVKQTLPALGSDRKGEQDELSERTSVSVNHLNSKQRLQELAQLAAGEAGEGKQAKNSLAFAKTLLEQATVLKQKT
jgi:DNA repair protein RecN (Recombination protein N)